MADFLPGWYRTGIQERDERRKEFISKTSTLVLVAALVFEIVCVARSNVLAGRLVGSINTLATNANEQAQGAVAASEQAIGKAQNASGVSAAAKKSADEAVSKAKDAEARLVSALQRTARLEDMLSWRTVTPDQRKKLRSELEAAPHLFQPLRGLAIDISYENKDSEAEEYADELEEALGGLGATINDRDGRLRVGGSAKDSEGLFLTAKGGFNPIAALLEHAMSDSGIPLVDQSNEGMKPGIVSIWVGQKPRGRP